MKKLAALVFGLVPTLALAGTATVTVGRPTHNTDGSVIPATGPESLASYRTQYGTCAGTAFGTLIAEVVVPIVPSHVISDIPPGSYCFRVYARNAGGNESDPSNVVAHTIVAAAPPQPPTLVIGPRTAYQVVGTVNGIAMLPVGTSAANTSCNTGNYVVFAGQTYYHIARTSVTWFGSVRPQAVFAVCS